MSWLARLSYDAAEWNEADHPRDKDGKFGSGGGGSASEKENAQKPTKTIKVIMAKAGFKKMYSANPLEVKFQDKASGVKVTVHLKGAGQPTSGKWSLEDPKSGLKHGEGSSLAKLVGVIQVNGKFKNAQKQKEQSSTGFYANQETSLYGNAIPSEMKKIDSIPFVIQDVLKSKNFKYTVSSGNDLIFHAAGTVESVSYNTKSDLYTVYTPDGNFSGAGPGKLTSILDGAWQSSPENKPVTPTAAVSQAVAAQPTPTAKAQTLSHSETLQGVKNIIGPKGYEFDSGSADVPYVYNYFSKDGNSGVQINSKTGEWIAKTAGFPTKEGNGLDNLKKLMAGEKVSGSPPSWKNTSKQLVHSSEKKKAEEKEKAQNTESATMKHLKSIAPQPTDAEKDAIGKYTGSYYMEINNKLRKNPFKDNFEGEIGNYIKALDSYFEKSSFTKEVTLYRKVAGEHAKTILSTLIEGESVFTDTGFISTSTHSATWSGELQYKITAPKGTKGAAVKEWSSHSPENEVMLPRKTKFKVDKIDHEAQIIHVTVLGTLGKK